MLAEMNWRFLAEDVRGIGLDEGGSEAKMREAKR